MKPIKIFMSIAITFGAATCACSADNASMAAASSEKTTSRVERIQSLNQQIHSQTYKAGSSRKGLEELNRFSPKNTDEVLALSAIKVDANDLRLAVYDALVRVPTGSAELKGTYKELLGNKDETVRKAAIHMCGKFRNSECLPKLRALLKDTPKLKVDVDDKNEATYWTVDYARELLGSLVALNDFTCVDEIMGRDEFMASDLSSSYLAKFGERIMPKAIANARKSGVQRKSGLGIIRKMRDDAAIPDLVTLLQDKDNKVSLSAASALANMTQEQTEITVESEGQTTNKHAPIQSSVSRQQIESALEAQLKHPSGDIRRNVYEGLLCLDSKKHLQTVIDSYKKETSTNQLYIFYSFAKCQIKDAVPFMEQFMKDDEVNNPNDSTRRKVAAQTIYSLTGKKVPYNGLDTDMQLYKDPYEGK